MSPAASQVIEHERQTRVDLDHFDPGLLWGGVDVSRLRYFHPMDFMAPPASGSSLTAGMVICPCSGATLSSVANGGSRNLIERAAEVHLKERRKLVLVQRETPLSLPTVENMRSVLLAGAILLPAMPAWYHGDASPSGLIDFIVGRILDQLDIDHQLTKRWGEDRL